MINRIRLNQEEALSHLWASEGGNTGADTPHVGLILSPMAGGPLYVYLRFDREAHIITVTSVHCTNFTLNFGNEGRSTSVTSHSTAHSFSYKTTLGSLVTLGQPSWHLFVSVYTTGG